MPVGAGEYARGSISWPAAEVAKATVRNSWIKRVSFTLISLVGDEN
ncbi:MAG TPA: hypothetical protein VFY61_01365 [Pyrinomonadaceae bacterium]|nr:hypothetical protein [Pyrinomonadaceae bacterium]